MVHIITTVHHFDIFVGQRVVALVNIKPGIFLFGGLGVGGFWYCISIWERLICLKQIET